MEAWLFIVKWVLNLIYEGRRGPVIVDAGEVTMTKVQTLAEEQLRSYIVDFLAGPNVPSENWEEELRQVRLDYGGAEVKPPEIVTWRQLEPALPPAGTAAQVRAADLAEGWLKECLEDPFKCLLPESLWPDEPPRARVWVEDEEEWLKICKNGAERGVFTFLKKEEVFHANGKAVFNGMFGVSKKGKKVPGGDMNILRMIINAVPTNSYQHTLEGDIRALPYFGQWSGIQMDDAESVLVCNELDMTAAFYIFRMEPAWHGFQALGKSIPGHEAGRWRPDLAEEREVFPAVTVMPMGWRSACGLLQLFHRKLCFGRTLGAANLDPSREVRRDGPLPPSGGSQGDSFYTVYLDGFSQAELRHWDALADIKQGSWETVKVKEAWDIWGFASQADKAATGELEINTLGCRIDGRLGTIAPPREALSTLLGLTLWFVNGGERGRHQGEVLGGRWVRMFQFRREVSCSFVGFWEWLHPESKPKTTAQQLPKNVVEDLLVAACLSPLLRFDLRARVSPLVIASDASESGMGVCRTSTITPAGLHALGSFQEAHNFLGDELGLIEVGNTVGSGRQALRRLGVRPGVFAVLGGRGLGEKVVGQTWPEVVYVDEIGGEDLSSGLGVVLARSARTKTWVVVAVESCFNRTKDGNSVLDISLAVVKLLKRSAPKVRVELLFEREAALSEKAKVKISDRLGLKPLQVVFDKSVKSGNGRHFLGKLDIGGMP